MKIGNVSFSKIGYENFLTLSKEEQVKKIADSLNPKSERVAKELLKDVKHGNISSRSNKKAKPNNGTGATGGNKNDNSVRSEADRS